jgi:hypothetical protein
MIQSIATSTNTTTTAIHIVRLSVSKLTSMWHRTLHVTLAAILSMPHILCLVHRPMHGSVNSPQHRKRFGAPFVRADLGLIFLSKGKGGNADEEEGNAYDGFQTFALNSFTAVFDPFLLLLSRSGAHTSLRVYIPVVREGLRSSSDSVSEVAPCSSLTVRGRSSL